MTENKVTLHTSDGMSRRTSARIRAHGVVAMTDLEKPVIATSYDISPGGVSFVHLDDLDVVGSEVMMDILLFDTQTDKEHFVSQVKGRIRSKERIFDPESDETVLRFGVEFLELDSPQRDVLRSCLDQTDEYFLNA
jgi:c-di-GMP-binding flagellar brake protein YcgR